MSGSAADGSAGRRRVCELPQQAVACHLQLADVLRREVALGIYLGEAGGMCPQGALGNGLRLGGGRLPLLQHAGVLLLDAAFLAQRRHRAPMRLETTLIAADQRR